MPQAKVVELEGRRMQAAVLHELGKPLEIADLEIDAPRAGEVRIEVAASGICRSDLSVATGTLKSPLPVVLGHEAAGVVTELGEEVTGLAVGDRVVVSLTPACGDCLFCKEGHPNRCVQMLPGVVGATMLDRSTRLRRGDETVYQLCGIASFAERVPDAPLDDVLEAFALLARTTPEDVPRVQRA